MILKIEEFTLEFKDSRVNVYWGDRGYILKTFCWMDSLTAIDDLMIEIETLLSEWDIDTDIKEIHNQVRSYYVTHIVA